MGSTLHYSCVAFGPLIGLGCCVLFSWYSWSQVTMCPCHWSIQFFSCTRWQDHPMIVEILNLGCSSAPFFMQDPTFSNIRKCHKKRQVLQCTNFQPWEGVKCFSNSYLFYVLKYFLWCYGMKHIISFLICFWRGEHSLSQASAQPSSHLLTENERIIALKFVHATLIEMQHPQYHLNVL